MSTSSLQPETKAEQKKGKGDMGRCVIVKEDVDPSNISKSDLTTDCYFIHQTGGKVDIARGSAVHILMTTTIEESPSLKLRCLGETLIQS